MGKITRNFATSIIAIIFFLVVMAGECHADENLIVNNNMESGTILPDSWINGGDYTTFTWTTNQSVSGNHSLCSGVSTDTQSDWRQLVLNIDDSLKYRFRFHVRATNVDAGSHYAELQWFSDSAYFGRDRYCATETVRTLLVLRSARA